MAFPLLKLPALIILQFLGITNFVELFFLSQVSKKMGRIIRNHAKIRNHVFELSIDDDVSLNLISLKTQLPVSSVILRPFKKLETTPFISNFDLKFGKRGGIPCISTNFGFGIAIVELFCADFTQAKEIYKTISNVFPLPLVKANLNLSGAQKNYKWAVKWLNTLNLPEIKIVWGQHCDHSQYIYTMQRIRPSGNLIFGPRPASFKVQWNLEGAYQ